MLVVVQPKHTNTGAATLNINKLGPRSITRPEGQPLQPGDLQASRLQVLVMGQDGAFILVNPPPLPPPQYVPVPAGSILMLATGNIPSHWRLCNGDALDKTTYPDLFAALGYTWGGSGTQFHLPNLQSRVPIAAGEGPGLSGRPFASTGGAEAHRLTEADLAAHTHTYAGHVRTDKPFLYREGLGIKDVGLPDMAGATTQPAGTGQAHNNMPPYVALYFIIKVDNA